MQQRKNWVDWAKVLGMFFIIYGHCFPETMTNFVYAFNVPVFFLISGYLCKKEPTVKVCWHKTLHSLVIPYYILAFIKVMGGTIKHLADGQWVYSVIAVLGGFHSLNDMPGCSNLWFVFSLIIIKLCYQGLDRRGNVILGILSLLGAWLYNDVFHIELRWALADSMLAFPYFILGRYLSQMQIEQICLPKSISERCRLLVCVLLLFVMVYVVSGYNGQVKMYMNMYGDSLLLFIVAALCGSAAILGLSLLFDGYSNKLLRVISSGTIFILVFHRELLHPLLKWIGHQEFGIYMGDFLMALSSAVVLIAFYPLILIVKKFLPIVLGRRKIE